MSKKQDWIKLIEKFPGKTATFMAKKDGRTKASKSDKDAIEELISEGKIRAEEKGRSTLYYLADGNDTSEKSESMTFDNDTQKKIYEYVKKNPGQTCNKISKETLKKKASKTFKKEVENMVNNGSLTIDTTGRFDVYFVNGGKTASTTKSKSKSKSKSKKVADKSKKGEFTPLVDLTAKVDGYIIEEVDDNKISITTPGGKGCIIDKSQRLCIINPDSPSKKSSYILQKPGDAIRAIQTYVTEKNIVQYTVFDLARQKNMGEKSFEGDDKVVYLLKISRHNKAG